jgi:hypothetical protein
MLESRRWLRACLHGTARELLASDPAVSLVEPSRNVTLGGSRQFSIEVFLRIVLN